MDRFEYLEERGKATGYEAANYADMAAPAPIEYAGAKYDSRQEFVWAQTMRELGIDLLTGADIDELVDGVGGWIPDFAIPRAGGGFVWVEVKPFSTDVSLFSLVRSQLENATEVNLDTDALLFLDALPTIGRPFGLGAVNYGHPAEREWKWCNAWFWRRSLAANFEVRPLNDGEGQLTWSDLRDRQRAQRGGDAGLRLECGPDLLLDDRPESALVDAAFHWLTERGGQLDLN